MLLLPLVKDSVRSQSTLSCYRFRWGALKGLSEIISLASLENCLSRYDRVAHFMVLQTSIFCIVFKGVAWSLILKSLLLISVGELTSLVVPEKKVRELISVSLPTEDH